MRRLLKTGVFGCLVTLATGCSSTNQYVLLGESFASGSEARGEADLFVKNANAAGCRAISVGGYAAVAETVVYGIPVLVECPQGVTLLPNGSATTP